MKFEWDSSKERKNTEKHDISFEEAVTVFKDPFSLIFSDPDHSWEERRLIIMGESTHKRLLVVS